MYRPKLSQKLLRLTPLRGAVLALVLLAPAGYCVYAASRTSLIENVIRDAPVNEVTGSARTVYLGTLAYSGNGAAAERAIAAVTDSGEKAEALGVLAVTLARAGHKSDAETVASEAERAAGSLAAPQTASELEREGVALQRQGVLLSVAAARATDGNLVGARETAVSITDPMVKPGFLSDLTAIFATTGHAAEAKSCVDDAEKAIAAIPGYGALPPRKKITILGQVAAGLTAAGNASEAKKFGAEVCAQISKVKPTDWSSFFILWTDTLIKSGNSAEINALAVNAEQSVGGISKLRTRESKRRYLAMTLAKIGNFPEAEKLAGLITDPLIKGLTLDAIASSFAAAGNVADAKRVAAEVVDKDDPTHGLRGVVTELVKRGDFAPAERIARSFADPNARVRALGSIADALTNADRDADAHRVAAIVADTALSIKDSAARTDAILDAAATAAKSGAVGEVERIAGACLDEAGSADTPDQKSSLLCAASICLAHAHDFAGARSIVDGSSWLRFAGAKSPCTARDRLIACTHIISEYTQLHDPKTARLLKPMNRESPQIVDSFLRSVGMPN